MAKITIILPRETLGEQAKRAIEKLDILDYEIRIVDTNQVLPEARMAISNQTSVIVARGLQAKIIKENTLIPVVDVTLGIKDIGLMIKKIKQTIKKVYPKIGLIGFKNNYNDLYDVEYLFDVKLNTYYIETTNEISDKVLQAMKDEVDIIIGGELVCEYAKQYNYKCMFLESSSDSIYEAIKLAKKIAYAKDKDYYSQFETMLDITYNQIFQIDLNRNIILANKLGLDLIGKSLGDVLNTNISHYFKELDQHLIEEVLNGSNESYITVLTYNQKTLNVTVAPIRDLDGIITGAIISLANISENLKTDLKNLHELYLSGHIAHHDFFDLETQSKEFKRQIEIAKKLAVSDAPILITSEYGLEYSLLAEAIHNNSKRKNGPFFKVNARDLSYDILFGNNREDGLVIKANHGTIYIEEMDVLPKDIQNKLFKTMEEKLLFIGDFNNVKPVDIRIITFVNREKMLINNFDENIYYYLLTYSVMIPSLKDRYEDLINLTKKFTSKYIDLYSKYVEFDERAINSINKYHWPLNIKQLDGFISRLVLQQSSKHITQADISGLISLLYPNIEEKKEINETVYSEKSYINLLLEKHHGNRKKVSDEMNISPTTLWRKMKKLGIMV